MAEAADGVAGIGSNATLMTNCRGENEHRACRGKAQYIEKIVLAVYAEDEDAQRKSSKNESAGPPARRPCAGEGARSNADGHLASSRGDPMDWCQKELGRV